MLAFWLLSKYFLGNILRLFGTIARFGTTIRRKNERRQGVRKLEMRLAKEMLQHSKLLLNKVFFGPKSFPFLHSSRICIMGLILYA